MDDAPEKIELAAFDSGGNKFTTLEGLIFEWHFQPVGPLQDPLADISSVIKLVDFSTRSYGASDTTLQLEQQGKRSYMMLADGLSSGKARIIARLLDSIYTVIEADVVISVIRKMEILPALTYLLPNMPGGLTFGLRLLFYTMLKAVIESVVVFGGSVVMVTTMITDIIFYIVIEHRATRQESVARATRHESVAIREEVVSDTIH